MIAEGQFSAGGSAARGADLRPAAGGAGAADSGGGFAAGGVDAVQTQLEEVRRRDWGVEGMEDDDD